MNARDTINRSFATTGPQLRSMLRRAGCTIAELSRRAGITQKDIRARLNCGRLIPGHIVIDWTEAAQGTLPPRIRAALRNANKAENEESNFECWLISRRVSL